MDLCCADPVQHLITVGWDIDYLDDDLSDLGYDLSDPH